eukprot:SAG31_NODE_2094_length_6458_cov_7.319547_6_plen_239_part_00
MSCRDGDRDGAKPLAGTRTLADMNLADLADTLFEKAERAITSGVIPECPDQHSSNRSLEIGYQLLRSSFSVDAAAMPDLARHLAHNSAQAAMVQDPTLLKVAAVAAGGPSILHSRSAQCLRPERRADARARYGRQLAETRLQSGRACIDSHLKAKGICSQYCGLVVIERMATAGEAAVLRALAQKVFAKVEPKEGASWANGGKKMVDLSRAVLHTLPKARMDPVAQVRSYFLVFVPTM